MPQRIYNFKPPTNPVLQVLYFLVGGVLLIGAVFMSAIVLAFVLGVAIVLGIVLYIRVWWLRRKMRQSGARPGAESSRSAESEVIEVEYTVIDERDERDN